MNYEDIVFKFLNENQNDDYIGAICYGSYVKKDVNLMKSINQIEIFDTVVAMLAGMMIIPAVYVFSGIE